MTRLEQLRQANVGNLLTTLGTQNQINQAEAQGDLSAAQADRFRALQPFIPERERAEIAKLKEEADRLAKLNPGSAEAQAAETRLRNAQADALDRATDFAKVTEGVDKKILDEKLEEAKRKNERIIDIPYTDLETGETKRKALTTDQVEAIARLEAARRVGSERAPTAEQLYQRTRQSQEDLQRDEKEAGDAENTIRNKPDQDNTANARTFNMRAREGYIYVPTGTYTPRSTILGYQNPLSGSSQRIKKIPLPRIKDVTGQDKQLTAREFWIMFNDPKQNPGLSLEDFAKYYYTKILQQPLPKEFAD